MPPTAPAPPRAKSTVPPAPLQQNAGTRRDRAARYTFVALLVTLAVLAVSGLYLTFHYRPSALGEHGARRTHQVTAATALGLVALLALLERGRRRRLPILGLAVAMVGAVAGGNSLPWDQLALWAVTVRAYSGVLPAAFDDTVRFVFQGRSEISQAAYRTMTLVHVVAISRATRRVPLSRPTGRSRRRPH